MKNIILIIFILIPTITNAEVYPGSCTFVVKYESYSPSVYNSDSGIDINLEVPSVTTVGPGTGSVGWAPAYTVNAIIYWYDSDLPYNNWKVGASGSAVLRNSKGYPSYPGDPLPDGCPMCQPEKDQLTVECGGAEGTAWEWTDKDKCEGQCIDPCQAEIDQLTEQCGGSENEAWKWTDKDNCEGECIYKDCTGPGEETLNEAKARCESDYSPGILMYYDAPQCRGVCGCLKADYISEKARYGKFGGIKYFSEVTCTATCGGCQDLYKKVKKECEEQYGVLKEFHCKDDNGTIEGTPTWLCDTNTKIPPAGSEPEPAPEPAPPDKTPEPDQPDNPSDPSDEKLGAIQKNLGKIIDQNNDRKNQLNTANGKLDWIGKNNKIIADNTKIIGDKLNNIDSGISDVNDNIKGLSDDLGNIDDTLKDISKGSYTKPTEKAPYETEEHSFGERTSEFLDQMKTTDLISLADQLITSIPTGGSPILTIHTGDTFGGDHTIDFSEFSYALNMMKYLLQISGMIIAIRIVTLKR